MLDGPRLLACLIWLVPVGCASPPSRPQATLVEVAVPPPSVSDHRSIVDRTVNTTTGISAVGWQATRSATAGGEDRSGKASPLTLERLKQLALQHNPTLGIARSGIDVAIGSRVHAARRPNPLVGYIGNEIGAEGGAGQQGVFYQVELLRDEKRELSLEVGRLAIERATRIADARRLRVLNDVELAAIDVRAAQQAQAVSRQLEMIAEQGLETARQLVKLKQVGRADVLQAGIELNQSRLFREQVGHRAVAARRRLAAVVGLSQLPAGALPGPLDPQPASIDWEQAAQTIQAQSPVFAAARVDLARARSVVARAEVEPTPNLKIQTAVQHDAGSRGVLGTLQLGWAVPSRYGNEGQIAAATAAVVRARREMDRLTLKVADRLAQLRRRHDNARVQLRRQSQNRVSAEENLKLTSEGYRLQEYPFVRVLTARRTLAEIQVAQLDALTQLHRIAVEINGLLLRGGLDPVTD